MNIARSHYFEAAVGLIVVIASVWLVFAFLGRTANGAGSDAIEISALFPNVSGVDVGTDVRVAGMSIGEVTAISLSSDGYQADVRMAIDPAANIPNDSSAAISSEGLLGGSYIALLPGGSLEPMQEGDVIFDTQGALDMSSLIGSFINDSGGSDDGFDTMAEPDADGTTP
ncbi:outer membrane lipid asymmetry maintenance protein MlaD [Parasphingopyxis marina]|uniref:Outer membrane lipid asymmetry maintenance protein MlaD n=1 Tax=Parasphingopyxis marina TaxID=2761622 RepID=A0A842HW79_9SPHN|nr:outer membrane lipid asymmetry maintenance protein MlaD [Parasphingopyxis marina]MBC2777222.1 outer membrane lipid asymmetry maintenance protein MlaD [Parasphingopyxis marina]